MNSEELKNRLSEIKKEMSSYNKLKEEKHKLSEIYISSIYFNIIDIIRVLTRLIELKEKKKHYPIVTEEPVRSEIHGYFAGDKIQTFAIVQADNYDEAFAKLTDYTHSSLINSGNDNIIIIGGILYNTYHRNVFNSDELNITFKSLIDKYTIDGEKDFSKCCENTFDKHKYENNFIEYLFDIQVQNNGKHLTYEEMQVALNNYLNLEKNKPKTKKLDNTIE